MTAPDLLQSALADVERARDNLQRYSVGTDTPRPGAADAADLLDAARVALDGAP